MEALIYLKHEHRTVLLPYTVPLLPIIVLVNRYFAKQIQQFAFRRKVEVLQLLSVISKLTFIADLSCNGLHSKLPQHFHVQQTTHHFWRDPSGIKGEGNIVEFAEWATGGKLSLIHI